MLELGSLIAGPFVGKTLADFGAEVVKIEPPGEGDPLRKWRKMRNGTSEPIYEKYVLGLLGIERLKPADE